MVREDDVVEGVLDEALQGLQGLVPVGHFELLRRLLRTTLSTHPDGRALLRQACPDPWVDHSADVAREGERSPSEESNPGESPAARSTKSA